MLGGNAIHVTLKRLALLGLLVGALAAGGGGAITLAGAAPASASDVDLDGILDSSDNCAGHYNPDQGDADSDALGDRCDETTGLPANEHRIVVYPRNADGSPRVAGCVIFTQYDELGDPQPSVNSCEYSDEIKRNRSFQDWIFAAGATKVDVEIPSPGGCGGHAGPSTFSFVAGANDYLDACVDLAVFNEATDEIVGAGERFSYYLSVENDGPGKAGAVTLTDNLPDGVTYVSADGLPCTEAAGVVTCSAGELEADGAAEVELVVQAPDQVGTIANEAAVTSETTDLDSSNNTASLATQVGTGADLLLYKYAEHAEPAEPVHFWVSVWNDGPQSAHGVVVEDTLPEGVDLVSATPGAGACSPPSGRQLTCSIGTVAAFDLVEIEIVVSGIAEGLLTNLASVTSTAPADPELDNNHDTYSAVIGNPPLADLAVFKDGPASGAVGADLVYGVSVENLGPEIAQDVRLADRLAPGVTFVSATMDGGGPCPHAGGTVNCELGDLGSGEAVDIEITVRPGSAGQLTNTAEVVAVGGPADPDPDSNTSTAETQISQPEPQPQPQPQPQPAPQPQPQPAPQPPRSPQVVRCIVPNVKGRTLVQARKLLAAKRCALGRVSRAYSAKVKRGRIISQSRRPGARFPRRTKVNVVLSRGRRR
jgi:uncharacterized repeat protein (TIGR01451 family)